MAKVKINAADQQFSLAIRTRDKWTCRACSARYDHDHSMLDCAHIYSRAIKSVRWDPMNAVALCKSCHRHFTDRPIEWSNWCKNELGWSHIEVLRTSSQCIGQNSARYRKLVAAHFRKQVALLHSGGELKPFVEGAV